MISVVPHSWGHLIPSPEACKGARLVFADPPYNQGVDYADDHTHDLQSPDDYEAWCGQVLTELRKVTQVGSTIWWMCPERHCDFIGPMMTRNIGPRLYRIIWRESFAQYQQKSLTQDYRVIFCHVNDNDYCEDLQDLKEKFPEAMTFNPDAIREVSKRQELGDKRADPRGRVPGQVWDFRRLQGTSKDHVDWHPTQLPPELLRRIVRGWTNPGDKVVDAFGGSGVMGAVCQSEKRKCVLVDRSPTYCHKMRERLGVKGG